MHPHIWYPYTQAKTAPPELKVKSAQGVWLELADGRQLLDAISSWWVNTHGHAHPKIAEAIYQQAQQLEQVIFSGFSHAPAEQLAEQLVQRLPTGLDRVFFSDNGSTAVEVALKMAYQYWVNRDRPRSTFVAFEGAYHGDTFGTMAVGGRSVFSQVFHELLFNVRYVPFPATHLADTAAAEREQQALAQLRSVLAAGDCAGILIEPLVQGAGGMQMCRPEFLQQLRQLATEADTLLIFDEVMTGFGRTGDWFACARSHTTPDIICLSKGITGGFLPLAVTVCAEQIYQAFYSDNPLKTLYHGHSYTANPLGCAAALAAIELTAENFSAFAQMEQLHQQQLAAFSAHPRVENLRVTGTIAALDVVTAEDTSYLNQVGMVIRQRSIEAGVLLRPLGNVLYVMPPYCITEAELAQVYAVIAEILDSLV
ncbi:MAG: adenosylmethionine--8-amino-7-oxononanoate transaminase [Leptolyngbya sp. SIO4C1]|nr:adenosylmethionine--8-amino-7-oxononanoate transaminase [Leptolyngbya sp. SIO4C1]